MQDILDKFKQACMDYGRNQFTNTIIARKLLAEIEELEEQLYAIILEEQYESNAKAIEMKELYNQ